jgi:hypothetical protein
MTFSHSATAWAGFPASNSLTACWSSWINLDFNLQSICRRYRERSTSARAFPPSLPGFLPGRHTNPPSALVDSPGNYGFLQTTVAVRVVACDADGGEHLVGN